MPIPSNKKKREAHKRKQNAKARNNPTNNDKKSSLKDKEFIEEDTTKFDKYADNNSSEEEDNNDKHDFEDDEDEEISEDEAFNSEDEKKYGSFFSSKKGDVPSEGSSSEDDASDDEVDSDDDESDDDDDDDDGDNGEYMLSLLDKIAPSTATKEDNTPNSVIVPENEFSSSGVKSSNLTLDELMKDISNTTSFGSIQKAMKVFHNDGQSSSSKAPLPKIVTERTTRKVHYTNSSKDVSLWNTVVHANRDAETLDFTPAKNRLNVTTEDWMENFEPETDFEKEISKALESKAAAKEEEEHADDDLGEVLLSMDDLKKRRGELAKLRALMFYEEQKRHYINKIKSKKYRKIRRKQKERFEQKHETGEFGDDDDEADKEEREKEEVARIKERMSLAHKNTSKWAKQQLRRGKNIDKETKQALSAQLQKGDDLVKRMKHTIQDQDDDEDLNDEGLLSRAKTILQGINNDDENKDDDKPKGSSLFQMDFMKKGLQTQREKAKVEARALLQDILIEYKQEDSQEVSNNTSEKKQNIPKTSKHNEKTSQNKSQLIPSGKLLASSLQHGNSNTVAITGNITVDDFIPLPQSNNSIVKKSCDNNQHTSSKEFTTSFILSNHDNALKHVDLSHTKKVQQIAVSHSINTNINKNDQDNPWMVSSTTDNNMDDTESKSHGNDVLQDATRPNSKNHNTAEATAANTIEAATNDPKASNIITPMVNLTQNELIKKAFAQPEPDLDPNMEEEFAQEKKELQDKNAKRKHSKDTASVSGWGSWCGEGIAFPNKKRRQTKKGSSTIPQNKYQSSTKNGAANVIVNPNAISKKLNHQVVSTIPYPYTTLEEYEHSMLGTIGKEWNVHSGVVNMTQEEIKTKPGIIINPISNKWKLKKGQQQHRQRRKF